MPDWAVRVGLLHHHHRPSPIPLFVRLQYYDDGRCQLVYVMLGRSTLQYDLAPVYSRDDGRCRLVDIIICKLQYDLAPEYSQDDGRCRLVYVMLGRSMLQYDLAPEYSRDDGRCQLVDIIM